ncbi:hypothetical protein RchiOBHm_Chr3g0494051 [Rosa chinensis]|uniref:Retrotransposon gag domain-containing protein n=1 Tax=Rosa chinensis TaxID=74649 RepID=A0A2P6RGV8_ROSCH|nr:hypothetical protein RchiOBHm_Chr3g0494051 [Rosa chinensis]
MPPGPQYAQMILNSHGAHNAHDPWLPIIKQMRLHFATFDGGNPVDWLNKLEQYFALYQIPEDRQVTVAVMHLMGEAADMWHLFKDDYPKNWMEFADLMMRQFGSYNRVD